MTAEPDQRPLGESLYRVLILNDDATPMGFVVDAMERCFGKDREAAVRTMLHIHHHGIGECGGVCPYEAAKNKDDRSYGLCPQAPASSPMRDGKKVTRHGQQAPAGPYMPPEPTRERQGYRAS